MMDKRILLIGLLLFSSCHPQTQTQTNRCELTAEAVLSCVSSSTNLPAKEVWSKFNSLDSSSALNLDSRNPIKLLCLSLHEHASIDQQQRGIMILQENLEKQECRNQALAGLLQLSKEKLSLHKKYLEKNWRASLKNNKSLQEQKAITLQMEKENLACQRRIKNLEQQVQKLKELESMLDNKKPL